MERGSESNNNTFSIGTNDSNNSFYDEQLIHPSGSSNMAKLDRILEKAIKIIKDNKALLIGIFVCAICLLLLGILVWKDKFGWQAWMTIVIVFITFVALIKGITLVYFPMNKYSFRIIL